MGHQNFHLSIGGIWQQETSGRKLLGTRLPREDTVKVPFIRLTRPHNSTGVEQTLLSVLFVGSSQNETNLAGRRISQEYILVEIDTDVITEPSNP